jgi:hypothetical protein
MNFTHKKGDTFDAVAFKFTVNSSDLNLTNCVLRMQLKKEYGGVEFLSLTSVANAGITITNAAQGRFQINQQVIDLNSGTYIYDIELKNLTTGVVKTYITGNFTITNDITR